MIPYRTKATMKILMELTQEEALQLFDVVKEVQKKFYIGDQLFPFNELKKEDAADNMKRILADSGLDIPAHLREPLERLLGLMIDERASMDTLESELGNAFGPVFKYDLFRPEASTKEQDAPHPDAVGPEDRPRDKPEEEARRKILSDYADMTVDCLMDKDMSFSEMFYVIDTAHAHLKAERALYRRRLDNTPIKGLWAMEERGQQDSA